MSKIEEEIEEPCISSYLISPSDALIVEQPLVEDDLTQELIEEVTEIDSNNVISSTNDHVIESEKEINYELPNDESVMSFQDGQEVQLDDGTTAFIFHNNIKDNYPEDSIQSIQLENGNTAYLYHPKSPNNLNLIWPMESLNVIKSNSQNTLNFIQATTSDVGTSTTIDTNIANGYEKKTKSAPKNDYYKVYKCEHENCNKSYSSAHHLKIHNRRHTGEKPYLCEWKDCKKDFSTSYALKSHHRVHTGEKPYTCPETQCSKAFKTSGDLRKHVRTHTGEKPFHCPFEGCGKAFTTSNICKVHIRTHTGEKPHKCPYENCNKSFANITNYRNHIRIHTGEKPYVCSIPNCKKQFTEYSSLYKHQSVHAVVKPFQCCYCGKCYRKANHMISHKKKIHNDLNGISEQDCVKLPKFVNITDHAYAGSSFNKSDNSFTFKRSTISNLSKNIASSSVVVVPINESLQTPIVVNNLQDTNKQISTRIIKKRKNDSTSNAIVLTTIDPLISERKKLKTESENQVSSIASNIEYGELYINEEADQSCSISSTLPSSESANIVSDLSNQPTNGIWLNYDESLKDAANHKEGEIPYVTIDIDGQKYLVQVVQDNTITSENAIPSNQNKELPEKLDEEKIASTFDYIVPGNISKIRLISSPKSTVSILPVMSDSIASTSNIKESLINEATS